MFSQLLLRGLSRGPLFVELKIVHTVKSANIFQPSNRTTEQGRNCGVHAFKLGHRTSRNLLYIRVN